MAILTPQLVVGLGNPGPRYSRTPHNVGFMVVEELARRRGWIFREGAGAYLESSAPVGPTPLVLLKPLTYMNRSGEAVLAWARAHGVEAVRPVPGDAAPESGPGTDLAPAPAPAAPIPSWQPLIVCDDLALPLGAVRLRANGSSGGQKGIESVIGALNGDDFPRLRLGIAPPEGAVPAAFWADHVLMPFCDEDVEAVAEMVAWAADAVECWLLGGVEAAASKFNRRTRVEPKN